MMICDLCGRTQKYPTNRDRFTLSMLDVEDVCDACEKVFRAELDGYFAARREAESAATKAFIDGLRARLSVRS